MRNRTEIVHIRIGPSCEFHVAGTLDAQSAPDFAALIARAGFEQCASFSLDLNRVVAIDSEGVRAVFDALALAGAAGISSAAVAARGHVRGALEREIPTSPGFRQERLG